MSFSLPRVSLNTLLVEQVVGDGWSNFHHHIRAVMFCSQHSQYENFCERLWINWTGKLCDDVVLLRVWKALLWNVLALHLLLYTLIQL